MKILFALLMILYSGFAVAEDKMVISADLGQAMVYVKETSDNEKYLRYVGAFIPGSGEIISKFADIYDVKVMEFHSEGGDLQEINVPGVLIREKNIMVVVREGEVCISACAYLALYSKRIQLNGLLAFHLPYFDGFNKDNTLYDISQSLVDQTLVMSRQLFLNGWKLYLYYVISKESNLTNYVVFTDINELDKFRMSDPATFTDPLLSNFQLIKLTSADLAAHVVLSQQNKSK